MFCTYSPDLDGYDCNWNQQTLHLYMEPAFSDVHSINQIWLPNILVFHSMKDLLPFVAYISLENCNVIFHDRKSNYATDNVLIVGMVSLSKYMKELHCNYMYLSHSVINPRLNDYFHLYSHLKKSRQLLMKFQYLQIIHIFHLWDEIGAI